MIVGVPREVKRDEYRVGMLPVGVEELTRAGHTVLVEAGAGLGSGLRVVFRRPLRCARMSRIVRGSSRGGRARTAELSGTPGRPLGQRQAGGTAAGVAVKGWVRRRVPSVGS